MVVVLLHGFLGAGEDWGEVAERLGLEGRCWAPTLPGHGGQVWPQGWDGFGPLVESLWAQVEAQGLGERVVLVGYSLGGRVALHMALAHPERVRGLVLESASPGLREEQARAARLREDVLRAARLREGGLSAFVEGWYGAPLFRSLAARPDLLARVKARRAGHDPEALASALVALSPGRVRSLWGDLPRLEVPILCVAGALDEAYVGVMTEAAGLLPRASLVVLEGAGHNAHLEDPAAFVEALGGFLEGLEARR